MTVQQLRRLPLHFMKQARQLPEGLMHPLPAIDVDMKELLWEIKALRAANHSIMLHIQRAVVT